METYIPRFFKVPDQSYFLFGPRGTGKSTLLRHLYPDALWVDLLQPDLFRTYSTRPERIIELVHGNPDKRIIIIDEIQKVPELLSAVHSLIEEKANRTFVLTGSSARKLKQAGVNLLAGRALFRTLHPFLFSELQVKPDLDNVLLSGLLPVVISSENPVDVLNAYVTLYIREEVQLESLVRDIGNFSRFLEAVSFSHASLLNVSNVARECEVERKTVEGYIQVLEDILLSFKIPVFSKRAKRALVSRSKFYLFDCGVFQSLRPQGPLDQPEAIAGASLEGLVAQHLRAWNAYENSPYGIYYWRSKGGVEVDFILYGEKGICAIEVKNSNRIRPESLRPLKEFRKDYPESRLMYLYRGKEKLLIDNVQCMPVEDFLMQLRPGFTLIKPI